MSEHIVQLGEDEVTVKLLAYDVGVPVIYEARLPNPTRYIEQHLRGYGRDEQDAVINLLQLRASRDMLKMMEQG